MEIKSVYDPSFKPYGKVLEGYDTAQLAAAMNAIPLPEAGVAYQPGIESLEACGLFSQLADRAYGGMPLQLGMCWGRNTKLNCLEYHRDSEINVGAGDFILLLAKMDDIVDGKLDTAKVRGVQVPAGVVVQVYETTLHYAPCHVEAEAGFRVAVALPKGTNTAKPEIEKKDPEDSWLWARNKWLLAHPDTNEAKAGAYVGLEGSNIDLA